MHETPVRVLQLHTPAQIRAELVKVGADSSLAELRARAEFQIVKIERVSLPLARFLYQELVMEGGQVVTAARLEHSGAGETDVLLCATRYQLSHLLVRVRSQPDQELQALADHIERALEHFVTLPPALQLGENLLDWSRTYVMGILNVTPDSFSGDALILPNDDAADWTMRAIQFAQTQINAGADILDIGGESTRPGALPVDVETELQRVLPILHELKNSSVPISIDTSKAIVADAALNAGAVLVNDVTGLRGDADMAGVVAAHNAAVVIMHNGKPNPAASDFLSAILADLDERIEYATNVGIQLSRILIDPGLGFGKTTAQNLEIINRLGEFRALGCPLLLGPSRKGFISKATGAEVYERDAGTTAAITLGIAHGANIVRVHDVALMTRVVEMADALLHQPVDSTT